ncbi:MAG: decarboxylating NADP(+)-dependent phosphogluconate dehydrogenase [Spirochaetales bacterium]|nr:decarboxylating NADP(+)-dependent phosphogluconate dehydrogenase [Spirochaetales bacterium]
MSKMDVGVIGLAVMGENLALNIESRGYSVSVYNRTYSKTEEFIKGRAKDKNFKGFKDIKDFVESLNTPRKIILMVKAGEVVDSTINLVSSYLNKGDVIVDGGNSDYRDTESRVENLKEKGIIFVGSGVSGGEEGALLGPSLMPGGNPEGWPLIKNIFTDISAKTSSGEACCNWMGAGGAGHFVKMVHNGIEYGDMQLISEAYNIMKNYLKMNNEEIGNQFSIWNKGVLNSYLIEITSEIFKYQENNEYVLDKILDVAGQKGTGKWTVETSLDLANPLTLITEAVFSRYLSSIKELRTEISNVYKKSEEIDNHEKAKVLEYIESTLFSAKIISYTQGFALLIDADMKFNWNLNMAEIAETWRGGCIIRSSFLDDIANAFRKNRNLKNLLLDEYFINAIATNLSGFKKLCSIAVLNDIPIPAFSSALNYFNGLRSDLLPANLIQAQRDYFGAHTYERVDKERGEFFHSNWTGRGGSTASTNYNI